MLPIVERESLKVYIFEDSKEQEGFTNSLNNHSFRVKMSVQDLAVDVFSMYMLFPYIAQYAVSFSKNDYVRGNNGYAIEGVASKERCVEVLLGLLNDFKKEHPKYSSKVSLNEDTMLAIYVYGYPTLQK